MRVLRLGLHKEYRLSGMQRERLGPVGLSQL